MVRDEPKAMASRKEESVADGRTGAGSAWSFAMSDNDWAAMRDKLKADGFCVEVESLYFQQRQPFWRACASRDGRTWSASGGNLDEIFAELETQTRLGDRLASHPPKESLSRALRSAGRTARGRFSSL